MHRLPRTPAHWAYQGEEGPAHWSELDAGYATCGAGSAQSPVDIHGAQVADLDAIVFDYHAAPLSLVDNGHTVMVSFLAGSSITVGGHMYMLKQLHFHHPAEEEIEGKSADMVIHLVHADAAGNLAVVAVPLKAGEANAMIETLWKNIPAEKNAPHTDASVMVDPAMLLPAGHGYYSLTGSLTTPPCSEHVSWFVLKSPVTISGAELAAFAKIYPLNARPVQPLHGRQVLQTP